MIIRNSEHLEAYKFHMSAKNPNNKKIAALKTKAEKCLAHAHSLETAEESAANIDFFISKISDSDELNSKLDNQKLCEAAIEDVLSDMDTASNGYSVVLEMIKRLGYQFKDDCILQKQ